MICRRKIQIKHKLNGFTVDIEFAQKDRPHAVFLEYFTKDSYMLINCWARVPTHYFRRGKMICIGMVIPKWMQEIGKLKICFFAVFCHSMTGQKFLAISMLTICKKN